MASLEQRGWCLRLWCPPFGSAQGRFRRKPRRMGQPAFVVAHGEIKIKVKGSGQECPLHTMTDGPQRVKPGSLVGA